MTLTPKDWQSLQSCKDRAPPWIKLHRALLDDFEFHRLPVASRALAPMLWLLAAGYEAGAISASHAEIAFRRLASLGRPACGLTLSPARNRSAPSGVLTYKPTRPRLAGWDKAGAVPTICSFPHMVGAHPPSLFARRRKLGPPYPRRVATVRSGVAANAVIASASEAIHRAAGKVWISSLPPGRCPRATRRCLAMTAREQSCKVDDGALAPCAPSIPIAA
ncbi:hypothetical protein [Bradyrhizobium sp.]|uniref:hypothetical protein n=1 Tax=Bradyrhizobium sp. TaxID=376 RepID=UPI003C4655F4